MLNYFFGTALEYDDGALRVVDVVISDNDDSFASGDAGQTFYVNEQLVGVNHARTGQGNAYHSTLTGAYIPSRGTYFSTASMVSLTDGRVLFFSASGFDAEAIAASPAGFDFTLPGFPSALQYEAQNPGLDLDVTLTPPGFLLPDDFGETAATAGAISVGGSVTGELEGAGDTDWFAVSLTAGVTYQIDLEGLSTSEGTLSDPLFEGIYDAAEQFIPGTSDDDGGTGLNSQTSFTPVGSGTHYLSATAFGTATGSYSLSIVSLGILGTASGDVINGTLLDDEISGLGGDDTLRGGAGNDVLNGGEGNDRLVGQAGDDTLSGGIGEDRLIGGGRGDVLIGGADRDIFTGSTGVDVFVFADGDFGGATAAIADRIVDFGVGGKRDDFDLSGVDAVTGGADDAFTFIGSAGFSNVAGELRVKAFATTTRILGDTDGDGIEDFVIKLDGVHTLLVTDFIL